MNLWEGGALWGLRQLDPELAHGLSIRALQLGLVPAAPPDSSARLRTEIAGLTLPNPLGLAAGFDKNAQAMGPLADAGFGFVELGAVTPRAQPGNPRPRLFRLTQDQAAINRFGFNNDGADLIARRLAFRPAGAVIGLNLGANKDSSDRAADYAQVLRRCGPYLDFVTVNVSSPNTANLRDLQQDTALTALLSGVLETRQDVRPGLPVFLKVAPDLGDDEIAAIARVAMDSGIDAIIATNTTTDRQGLTSPGREQAGGLSGKPLFQKSTRALARFHVETGGAMPLIGVGGISSARDAYDKICAGASAVQLYTAMVFHGISLVRRITTDLDALLERRGTNVAAISGSQAAEWANR